MRIQKIIPSIMAKNQKELNSQINLIKDFAHTLHLDITDGNFVNNKTFQFPFKLKKGFNYMAHLMIENPEKWIKKYFKAIDLIIPHIETLDDPIDYFMWIKGKNKPAAFAILPETKVKMIEPALEFVDYVLILTVKPGFYGSKFMKSQLKKIKQIKKINPKVKVIVDGGMDLKNIELASDLGTDHFISGSYIMAGENPKKNYKELHYAWAKERLFLQNPRRRVTVKRIIKKK
jgi:ribulose-phosphate 3-epimerase